MVAENESEPPTTTTTEEQIRAYTVEELTPLTSPILVRDDDPEWREKEVLAGLAVQTTDPASRRGTFYTKLRSHSKRRPWWSARPR